MTSPRLKGRTALVTGGAKRIGRAIALALGEEGVNVALHYRNSAAEAQSLRDELALRGVKAWLVRADLSEPAECESLIRRAAEMAGSLDFLINSASTFRLDNLENVDYESLAAHMKVNAWAPFELSRQFSRLGGSGKIVNLLDARIEGYDWWHVGYILSKHALSLLTRMTAVAFAPRITVNAVAPGPILPPPSKDEEYLDRLAQALPLKRRGDPSDIAEAVVYLLRSDFVTGQTLYVDGGWRIRDPGHGPNPD